MRRRTGTFNATGPAAPLTLGETLERVHDATGAHAELEWVAGTVLTDEGLKPWDNVPLWLDLPRHPKLVASWPSTTDARWGLA